MLAVLGVRDGGRAQRARTGKIATHPNSWPARCQLNNRHVVKKDGPLGVVPLQRPPFHGTGHNSHQLPCDWKSQGPAEARRPAGDAPGGVKLLRASRSRPILCSRGRRAKRLRPGMVRQDARRAQAKPVLPSVALTGVLRLQVPTLPGPIVQEAISCRVSPSPACASGGSRVLPSEVLTRRTRLTIGPKLV